MARLEDLGLERLDLGMVFFTVVLARQVRVMLVVQVEHQILMVQQVVAELVA
jgi:hypothetical protein